MKIEIVGTPSIHIEIEFFRTKNTVHLKSNLFKSNKNNTV